jgi:mono/diheme cytochrome c family protein
MAGDNSLGAHVFAQACASCHRFDGTGAQTPNASLIGTRGVNDPEATNVTQVVLHGASLDSPRGTVFMPGFGKAYSEAEIAAVVNYVTGRFGAQASTLTAEDVRKRREGG